MQNNSTPPLRQFFEAAERAGFRIFHKEPNTWGCGGHRCIEYAFVSKEQARTEHDMTHCADPPGRKQRLRGVAGQPAAAEEKTEDETAAETASPAGSDHQPASFLRQMHASGEQR